MKYILFLDDERSPSFVRGLETKGMPVLTVRSYEDATETILSLGIPAYISFDHDLGISPDGKERNGYDLAKWLVEQDLDGTISLAGFSYGVHSMNPIGAKNIASYLDRYMETL